MFIEFCNLILKYCGKIKYVLIYYVLGAKGILHDLLYKRYNHVELKIKTNHVAVVTGGARGIGLNIVKMLMECDMHVVIGCRDVKKGETAIENIRKLGVVKGKASVIELDLTSLKSVQKFASSFLERHKYLNLLVNNAGIMFVPYEITEDGFEAHLSVNYLGHFLLTHLLLPAMEQASSMFPVHPRIVNVSSCAHDVAPEINFDDINMVNYFIEHAAYAQSKLFQIMFTKSLCRHLKMSDSSIQVIAVHPGVVDTELFNGTLIKLAAPWLLSIFCKSSQQGATSVVYCCIDASLENASGSYYSNCLPQKCYSYAEDVKVQEKLHDFSMKAVKHISSKTD